MLRNLVLVLALLSIGISPVFAEGDSQKCIRAYIGYNRYEMKEFNEKLIEEDNNPIKGGGNVGLEFSPIEVEVPKSTPLIGGWLIKLPMVGAEYLTANSNTTHRGDDGTSATVNWNLPVVGIYVAPIISFSKKSNWFYLRPVGIGYYTLLNAKLTVSDRPGWLEISGETVGTLSQVGVQYLFDKFAVFIEGGWRWLKFTDVFQDPKDDFPAEYGGPPVEAGNLPQPLDYSGVIVRLGIGFQFQ